jgi:hypothetical protein
MPLERRRRYQRLHLPVLVASGRIRRPAGGGVLL